MKTYEELKAMTTEDLVRYAMEMQDKAVPLEKDRDQYKEWWTDANKRLKSFKDSIANIVELV